MLRNWSVLTCRIDLRSLRERVMELFRGHTDLRNLNVFIGFLYCRFTFGIQSLVAKGMWNHTFMWEWTSTEKFVTIWIQLEKLSLILTYQHLIFWNIVTDQSSHLTGQGRLNFTPYIFHFGFYNENILKAHEKPCLTMNQTKSDLIWHHHTLKQTESSYCLRFW